MIGQRIGNYHVVRQLSQGSAAVVYEALHRRTKQQVAIRVLRPDLSQDQLAGVRLFNDVAALGGVQHRSVLTVHEAGMLPDGSAYVVMEYIEGHTLSARLRGEGGELDGAVALSVAWQLAGVLRAAHQRGVLHGDLRPDGVMLVAEQAAPAGVRVKLPDLGLAWLDGPMGPIAGRLTGAGAGPLYLAPEQLHESGETTPLSDVFSLGAVLYLLLTGRPPFSERGTADALTGPLRPLRELDESIPAELAVLVESMLDANPARRPDTEQVATALERLCVAEGLVPGPAPQSSQASKASQTSAQGGAARRGRGRLAIVAGALVTAALGGVVVVGLRAGWRPGGAAQLFAGDGQRLVAAQAGGAEETAGGPPAAPKEAAGAAKDVTQATGEAATAINEGTQPAAAEAPKEQAPGKEPAGPQPAAAPEAPKEASAAAAEAPADAAKRPTPVAIDKAPIPPLRLDLGKAPPAKKKPGRPAPRPARPAPEAPEAPPETE